MSKSSASAVPPVDLRALMAPVRDQGQRGTCLAFAVTAAHEVGRSGGSSPEDLSEEALYWGCKRTDGELEVRDHVRVRIDGARSLGPAAGGGLAV